MIQGTTALFVRAMRDGARGWRLPLIRLGVGGVLLLMVLSASNQAWRGAGGLVLLSSFAWVSLIATTVLGIGLFGSAIAAEKEEGTLPLLRLAGIGSLALLLGTGAARLWELLLALAAVPPFLVLAVTLGGVSLAQVGAVLALLASHAALVAGMGVLASTLARTSAKAANLCIILLLLWWLLPPLVEAAWPTLASAVADHPGPWLLAPGAVAAWIHGASVWSALEVQLDQRAAAAPLAPALLLASGLGGAAFLLAWVLLPRCGRQEAEPAPPRRRGWRGAWGRVAARLRGTPPRGAWAAVLWKDAHLVHGGWPVAIAIPVVLGGVIVLIIASAADRDPLRSLGQALMAVGCLGGALVTTLRLGLACTGELRERTCEGLLLLPISAGALVAAKTVAALLAALPVWGLAAAGLLLATDDAATAIRSLLSEVWGWAMIATVLYTWAWSLWLSAVLRRLAAVAAVLVTILTWFIASLLLVFFRLAEDGVGLVAGLMTAAAVVLARDTPARVLRRVREG